jgi:hypothetical protein
MIFSCGLRAHMQVVVRPSILHAEWNKIYFWNIKQKKLALMSLLRFAVNMQKDGIRRKRLEESNYYHIKKYSSINDLIILKHTS